MYKEVVFLGGETILDKIIKKEQIVAIIWYYYDYLRLFNGVRAIFTQ